MLSPLMVSAEFWSLRRIEGYSHSIVAVGFGLKS